MNFIETKIPGAYIIELKPFVDERGAFMRSWCANEFAANGLAAQMVQANISSNRLRGTLRGMHYQHAPHAEAKLVRCTRGAVYDVALDLRPESPTYRQWTAVELDADTPRLFYIPEGCAHGFMTLADDTELMYQVSAFYAPGNEGGVRYDDPAFGIEWPLAVSVISAKDQNWPDVA
ncbi:MAG: dTDP-4-dehydrorhamnose 3,5-epimerase [Oscillochloridaceae bacterium umkhey_bin13]